MLNYSQHKVYIFGSDTCTLISETEWHMLVNVNNLKEKSYKVETLKIPIEDIGREPSLRHSHLAKLSDTQIPPSSEVYMYFPTNYLFKIYTSHLLF